MHHLPRRKGSDHGLLTESGIETVTGSPPHLKIGSGIVQGIDVEEGAVLAPVPVLSLQRGEVTLHVCYLRREDTFQTFLVSSMPLVLSIYFSYISVLLSQLALQVFSVFLSDPALRG